MYTSALYRNSPIWVQELLISGSGLIQKRVREGRFFQKLLQETEARQYWSTEQLNQWRDEQLRIILKRAQTTVPYYRQRYGHVSLFCEPLAQLEQYELLKKNHIVNNPSLFSAIDSHSYLHVLSKTSGTTGTPLTLYRTFSSINKENAFVWRQLHWANFRQHEKMATLFGTLIIPEPRRRKSATFWRMNRSANILLMSSYHLAEQNIPAYLQALHRFDPITIRAYPSSISYLANWLWHRGEQARLNSLKSIVTSSETLTAQQRERIETTFGVKVFDWYGSSERVAAIGTCEYGQYHVMEDYGYTEFGPQLTNGFCEIIGTGFINHSMPLIRYATGDLVELDTRSEPCPCQRAFKRVKRIMGRLNDVIKTPDGRTIGLIDPIYNGLSEISEAQVVQNTLQGIEIHVVATHQRPLSQETRSRLIANLRARVGLDMTVQVVEKDNLPRTNNGKIRTIVSNI